MDPYPDSRSSPYDVLENARRARQVVTLCNRSALYSAALAGLLAVIVALHYSPYLLSALVVSAAMAPLGLLNRRLALRGRHDLAGQLQFIALLVLVAAVGLLLDGFYPILAPGFLMLIADAGMILKPHHSYGIAGAAGVMYLASQVIHGSGFQGAQIPEQLSTVMIIIMILLSFTLVASTNIRSTSDLRRALDEATYNLIQANRKLKQASEMKSQFTARTSHELRTPLSSMIVFTDLALRDAYGPINGKLRSALTHVLTSARHLKAIINDILDLSKIEAGQLVIAQEEFELSRLAEAVQSASAALAAEKGLGFSVLVSPELPPHLRGDESRLAQTLVNLTSNAVKFTEHGEVEVRIEPAGLDRWRVIVHDTGPGIPEDQFETIFQAYRQLDGTASASKIKGTGLGLAITRHLVRLMGGTIQVESELGQGSTFTVELPLAAGVPVGEGPEPILAR